MLDNGPSTHHTITRKIRSEQQNEWEFECPICGYRVRYIAPLHSNSSQLEILHIGDAQARHLSDHVQRSGSAAGPTQVMDDDHNDEAWLTPELRQQMEDLLKDVNMGDGEIYQ